MTTENLCQLKEVRLKKITYCMSPFICNVQNRQIDRDRKQVRDFSDQPVVKCFQCRG